jgi:hypothetical protein
MKMDHSTRRDAENKEKSKLTIKIIKPYRKHPTAVSKT